MNFTGLDYRYTTAMQTGTFVFQNLRVSGFAAISGGNFSGQEFRIGLTGIHSNTGWYFSFRNGNMYDPQGRFFGSYNPEDINTLSGNFESGIYDYYLNDQLICSVGIKTGFDVNGWFTQCLSGASAQGQILLYSPAVAMTLNFAPEFYQSGTWTGTLSHNNIGPVVIRSGLIFGADAVYFSLGNSLDFNSGNNVIPTGSGLPVVLTNTGVTDRTGQFIVSMYVYTDFGIASFSITGSATLSGSGYIGNSFPSISGTTITVTGSGVSGTSGTTFASAYTDPTGGPLPAPIYVALQYLSGVTGLMTHVTGILITNSGSGYTSNPLVTVTPVGSGYPVASGTGLVISGHITGISWSTTISGIRGIYPGATGQYSLTFTDPSGSLASGTPLWGSGYMKAFSGQFRFATGNFGVDTGINAASNYFSYSGLTTGVSGINVLGLNIAYYGLPDTAYTYFLVRASGLPDSTTTLSLYSGSGVAYRT